MGKSARVDLYSEWLTPAVLADYSDDGQVVATITADRRVIKVHDARTGVELTSLGGLSCPAVQVDCNRDGSRLATLGRRQLGQQLQYEMLVWDVAAARVIAEFQWMAEQHADSCSALALDPDGNRVARAVEEKAISTDGRPLSLRSHVQICELPGGKLLLDLPAAEDSILALAFSGDGRMLAAGSTTGELRIWNARDGSLLLRQGTSRDLAIFRLAFNPDGKRLAGADREKVRIWGIREAQELIMLQAAPPRPYDGGSNPTLIWSPDGHRLASTNWDGSISVWDGFPASSSLGDRMAEARSRRFGWHLREAERAVGAGQAERARFHLDYVRDEPSPDDSFSCRRARLHLRFGEWNRAADDYAAWFAGGGPDEGAAWLGCARALLLSGNAPVYEKLCQRLEREIDRDPFEQILWQAARVFALAPHPASAARSRKAFELASHLAGNHRRPNSAFLRGMALYRAGNWTEALAALNRSTVEEPARAWVNLPLLALIHHQMGQSAEARSALAKAHDHVNHSGHGASGRATAPLLDPETLDFLILHAEARALLGVPAVGAP